MTWVFQSTYYTPDEIQLLWFIHIVIVSIVFLVGLYYRRKVLQEPILLIVFFIFGFIYFYAIKSSFDTDEMVYQTIKNKTYKIVEGTIENYKPVPPSGHINESFEINGIKFETAGNDDTIFFNLNKNSNSPIKRNGQKVKIHYIKTEPFYFCIFFLPKCLEFNTEKSNLIIYLEIDKVD